MASSPFIKLLIRRNAACKVPSSIQQSAHRPGILVDADELVEALQADALDAAEPDPVLLHRTEIHALPPVFSIQRAVLYGLGDVLGLDALLFGQVGEERSHNGTTTHRPRDDSGLWMDFDRPIHPFNSI